MCCRGNTRGGLKGGGGKRREGEWGLWGKGEQALAVYRQVSFSVNEPLAGVVICMFGSDSQVTLDWYLRMYLYWIAVFAGRFTVTERGRGGQRPARWGRTKGAG